VTGTTSISAAVILVLLAALGGASERVRTEKGRWSIQCRNAPLPDVLREIAAVAPMEVWLDEGVEEERVSLDVIGVTMKAAVEKLFESSKLNYVLYLDSTDAERVAKIYVGSGGGGRLGREPTVAGTAPPEGLDELEAEQFLESPEAQEALKDLKSFLEQQKAAVEERGSAEPSDDVPLELDELLGSIPELPASPKEKEKRPQL
jgi:hypothetical protein